MDAGQNASTRSCEFRRTAERWIAENGEILALIRYDRAAGSKDFEFFTSSPEFESSLDALSPRTSVIVFKERQLPLRGLVTDHFISAALELIPDGEESLLWEFDRTISGSVSWHSFRTGESHAELKEELTERYGRRIAVGLYPPWLHDNDCVISAIMPDADGVVRSGAY
jgi:hypothetical protein